LRALEQGVKVCAAAQRNVTLRVLNLIKWDETNFKLLSAMNENITSVATEVDKVKLILSLVCLVDRLEDPAHTSAEIHETIAHCKAYYDADLSGYEILQTKLKGAQKRGR